MTKEQCIKCKVPETEECRDYFFRIFSEYVISSATSTWVLWLEPLVLVASSLPGLLLSGVGIVTASPGRAVSLFLPR